MIRKIVVAITLALVAMNMAWAGSQVEDVLNSCTTINCKSMKIRGAVQPREPFVIQIFAKETDCLRIDVVGQTKDMVATIAAPSVVFGAISDDRSAEDTRPLILLDPAGFTGWLTLAVSDFDGFQSGKFDMRYGRYNSGNPNCQEPVNRLWVDSKNPAKVVGSYQEIPEYPE
jgi:hypothetical protein